MDVSFNAECHSDCCKILTCPNDVEVYFSFQSDEDDERSVVYNTVGPNVCMGDHKVTAK